MIPRCPFCGRDEVSIVRHPHDNTFVVACCCGATGPECTSELEAERRWSGMSYFVDRLKHTLMWTVGMSIKDADATIADARG